MYKSEKVYFTGGTGHTLSGRLDLPRGAVKAYAIFAHCFTCGKSLKMAIQISKMLAASNIATLRFDFTGIGDSEGNFADTSFSTNVDDIVAAAGYLERKKEGPSLLIGHSMGGAAVLQAAERIISTKGVVVISAPSEPRHLKRYLTSKMDVINKEGKADVFFAGRPFTIKKQFVEDLDRSLLEPHIRNLQYPLLVLHSPNDKTVDIENAHTIFSLARHPKSFVSLDTSNHLLTDEVYSRYAGSVIASWSQLYLDH